MADFTLSAKTMNFDGLRSSCVRKLTMQRAENSESTSGKDHNDRMRGYGLTLWATKSLA